MSIINKIVLLLSVTLLLIGQLVRAQEPVGNKPNVVIILADDLGYADVGFNGCTDIPTPNIDRIAANGVKFTDAYVSYSVCGPSRAGLLTGRYQDRFGYGRNPLVAPNDTLQGLPLSERTLADELKKSDYTSMAIGKWHLGTHKSQYPLKRGFDDFFGFLGGGHRYFPEQWVFNDISEVKSEGDSYQTRLMRDNGRIDEDEYLTDALSREAVDFIEREKEEPFFLYLAYNAPHVPLQATDKYLSRFNHIKNKRRKTYAAMVSAMDDGVGLVLDKLKELGIDDNTMVFFLSDNGGPEKKNASNNGKLREGKKSLYEGGIRVPFAMQWPGHIPAGEVYENNIISLDIFATAVAQAGVKPTNKVDGVDLIPFLTDENKNTPHEELCWRMWDYNAYAVRNGDNKLIRFRTENDIVYNVKNDPGERKPLDSISNKLLYNKLKSNYDNWESQMADPIFLGLPQREEYTRSNPNRFMVVNPYKPDVLEPVVPEGYELTWADEFNSDGKLDESVWSYENGFARGQELQWYQPDNAVIKNGVLEITARREKVKNPNYKSKSKDWRKNRKFANYTSSSVNTKKKYSFQYGVIEVRARIDTSLGMWPAIWTVGEEKHWPQRGEIDILEMYRHDGIPKILSNVAWKDAKKKKGPMWKSVKVPLSEFTAKEGDWSEKFHVWKMDWTDKYIRLYLDDELMNEVDITEPNYADGFNPFHQPHHIWLNLAIGANGGNPSKTPFPKKYEVDYVRIYQKIDNNKE